MDAWVGVGQSLHVCCCWCLVRGISFAHVIQAPRMLVRCVQRQSPQRNWLQRCWLLPIANHPDVSEMLGSRFSAFFRGRNSKTKVEIRPEERRQRTRKRLAVEQRRRFQTRRETRRRIQLARKRRLRNLSVRVGICKIYEIRVVSQVAYVLRCPGDSFVCPSYDLSFSDMRCCAARNASKSFHASSWCALLQFHSFVQTRNRISATEQRR